MSLRSAACAITLSAALLLSSLACGRPAQPGPSGENSAAKPPHLILLTVDTLRADHMSLYGYQRQTTPALDQLAVNSVVFEQAIAQWPKTGTSFASMFIGRYPQSTGITHRASLEIPAGFGILPEALKANGYKTLAVVSNPVISSDLGWNRGFDEYVHTWGEQMSNEPVVFREQLSAQRVNELGMELLDRHGYRAGSNSPSATAEEPPLFLWLHYSDPHAPYYTPAGFENPFASDELFEQGPTEPVGGKINAGHMVPGAKTFRDYIAQYDANILITDQKLGEMVEHLRSLEIFENAVTVVTADHGESLNEHDLYFEHGPLPYNTTAHVPLLIALPTGLPLQDSRTVTPGRFSATVELIDLAPTLVELLLPRARLASGFNGHKAKGQAEFDQSFEGASLVPYLVDPNQLAEHEQAFSEAGSPGRRHYRSLQQGRHKFIYRQPGLDRRPQPRDFELYDLELDPLETNNLLGEHPDVVRRMRKAVLEFVGRAVPSLTEDRRPKDQKERDALKNMGYLQ